MTFSLSIVPSAAQLFFTNTVASEAAAASLTTIPLVSKVEGNKNKSLAEKIAFSLSRSEIAPVKIHSSDNWHSLT